MNWGNRLVLVFAGFVLLIGTLVYKAMHTKFELVSKDYYNEELRYQEKIDGRNNASVAGDLTLSLEKGWLTLRLPAVLGEAATKADAWFYCKTDATRDKKLHIDIQNGKSSIDTRSFAMDTYELKLQFSYNGRLYYYTETLTIQ